MTTLARPRFLELDQARYGHAARMLALTLTIRARRAILIADHYGPTRRPGPRS